MKHKNAVPETGKLMVALFALLLCICLTDGKCAASKTEIPEGYTPIKSVDDLYGINNNPEGSYILMNDIDLSQTAAGGNGILETDGNQSKSFTTRLTETAIVL